MAQDYYLRPQFHPSAPTGRIKAPAALVFENRSLHTFYLNEPTHPWGQSPISWGHVSAEIFGDFDYPICYYPDAITPGADYDALGLGAGALSKGPSKRVEFAYYSGFTQGENGLEGTINRVNVDFIDFNFGGSYVRDDANPIISLEKFPKLRELAPQGVIDPMLSWNPRHLETGDHGLRLITMPASGKGTPILFGSEDLVSWTLLGELELDMSQAAPGDAPDLMPECDSWEAVSLFAVRDIETEEIFDLLMFSLNGVEPVKDEHGIDHYASDFTCGYLLGHLEGQTFKVTRGFSELDYGFNFALPRSCAETHGDGCTTSTLMQGVIKQKDEYLGDSEDKYVWRNSLSLPRRVLLEDGRLTQHLLWAYQTESDKRHEPFGNRLLEFAEFGDQPQVIKVMDESGYAPVEFRYTPGERAVVEIVNRDQVRVAPCVAGRVQVSVDGTAIDACFGDGEVCVSIAAVPSPGKHWDKVEVNA